MLLYVGHLSRGYKNIREKYIVMKPVVTKFTVTQMLNLGRYSGRVVEQKRQG